MEPESKKGLFVRNLPYCTTVEKLKEIFSHYGETKACCIIKDKEGKSKGYGFVYYKSSDNAKKAKSLIKKIDDRPVLINFAKRRQEQKLMDAESDDDEDDYELQTSKEADDKPKNKISERQSFDIGRIVVLEGLDDSVTTKHLRVRCRKVGEVESIEYPVPGRETKTAFIAFVKHNEARVAVKKFDGKTIHGGSVKAVLLSREGKMPSKLSLKKSRLIVRNLEFKCSEEEVKEVFSPIGKVLEVHIPKNGDRSRGYAFVQYTSYFDAVKAVETINGILIKDRKVSVDFVSSKKALENEKGKADEPENKEEQSKEEIVEGEKEKSEEESTATDEDSQSVMEDEGEEDCAESTTSVNPNDVKEGKTLFVRNVPHDADEEELGQTMERFGQVRYCRLVMNEISATCRGTAFVQYRFSSSVRTCIQASCSDEGLWYDGRRLDVTLALSKEELLNVNKKSDVSNEEKDKRNLYLLREGVILRDSDAANELSKSELTIRIKSYDERKQKLKNPYYYISKTRLSVRRLPVTINENKLKVLFKSHGGDHAFIKQVKLLRSKDKFTEDGLGRSMGCGFVEFTQHEAALRALRAINNNPSLFGPNRRPIVEFALEDTRAIKRMKEKKIQSLKASKGAGNNDTAIVHSNPKVKWQLKCKARRLKLKERDAKPIKKNAKKSKTTIEGAKPHRMEREFHRKPKLQSGKNKPAERQKVRHSKPKDRTRKSEKQFNNLVDKYRNKMSVQDSRWFE